MPTVKAPLEKICATCAHYWFVPNQKEWRWAYCNEKKEWFSPGIEKPGEQKGCEEYKEKREEEKVK